MGNNQSSSTISAASHSHTLHLNQLVSDKEPDKEKYCVNNNTAEFRRTGSARYFPHSLAGSVEQDGKLHHQDNTLHHNVLIHHQLHSHDYLHVEYRANGHTILLPPGPTGAMPTEPALARSSPARSSVIRGSFRRIKAQLSVNVPPPVVPDDKLHRLSNVSLNSSSSGFGSSGTVHKAPDSTESNGSLRRNVGNLTLNIVVPGPGMASGGGADAAANGPSTPATANPPLHRPTVQPKWKRDSAPMHSPTFAPQPSSAGIPHCAKSPFASPLPSPLTPQSAGGLGSFHNLNWPTSGETKARDVYPGAVMYRTAGRSGLAPNGRGEYVELVCANEAAPPHHYYNYDPDLISDESVRNSRSSFSSFDGSSYSNGSLTNSPSICGSHTLDLVGMLHTGMTDNEVLSAWLGSVGLTEYFAHFIQAGYDMPSIARMTTEDLTGIGISKPSHRKRFRAEITRLPNMDAFQFGSEIPATIAQFLAAVKLCEYSELFAAQRLQTVDDMLNLTWEDLEEIGVKKLGHLKKLTLGIRHFRALKRHTVLLEQEQQLMDNNHAVAHSTAVSAAPVSNGSGPNDDATSASGSASLSSSGGGVRKLIAAPVLTTFQAPPSGTASPSKKPLLPANGYHPEQRRPHSAQADRPGIQNTLTTIPQSPPTARSPDLPSRTPQSPHKPQTNGASPVKKPVATDTTKTLPRRKSSRSIAQMVANVFHKEHNKKERTLSPGGPKQPPPVVNGTEYPYAPPSSLSLSSFTGLPSPTKEALPPMPLAAFASPRANQLLSRHPGGPTNDNPEDAVDFNDLASFPPPPSPLLRGMHALESLGVDVERTPTLPHRRVRIEEHGVPFARDDLGTVRQRMPVPAGVPNGVGTRPRAAFSPQTFCDPRGRESEVLDEISGMLANLTCELDQAMVQLEADSQLS